MIATGVFLFLAMVAVMFSVREKTRQINLRDMASDPARPSPLSRAIVELVGTAGGIYLSLHLGRDFLSLNVPDRVSVRRLEMEPLAALSLFLALVQPYVLRMYQSFKK